MANELRVRAGFKKGTLGAQLLIGGTTLNFGTNPGFATLLSTEHIAIVLDPQGTAGAPEIVYVTAYTSGNTTATIVRAQEGSTARQHESGVAWSHGPTVRDFSDLAAGLTCKLTSSTPGNAGTSDAVVPFDAAAIDDIGGWSAGSPNRITIPAGYEGLYFISFSAGVTSSATASRLIAKVRVDGSTVLVPHAYTPKPSTTSVGMQACNTIPYRFTAGQYIELLDNNLGGTLARVSDYIMLSVTRIGN